MTKVDLFLGSDLGLWILDRIDRKDVCRVFTLDLQIAELAGKMGVEVFVDNANVSDKSSSVGFSIHYPRILHPPLLERYHKIYNLHPGYLPWGRGYYPVFWAIWEQTPAGATLHEITAGIDEGPIVAQRSVEHFQYDTGGTLFERVREAEKEMFVEFWPRIVACDELPAIPQNGIGTYHSRKEFFDVKRSTDWRQLDSESLIRLSRALSFPGLGGLEITLGGKQFDVFLNEIKGAKSH